MKCLCDYLLFNSIQMTLPYFRRIFPLLFLVFLFFSSIIQAQVIVNGSIISMPEKSAVPFAAVALLSLTDSSVIKGVAADENGNFIIQDIENENYILKIQALGYRTQYYALPKWDDKSKEINVGEIALRKDMKRIQEVEISAEKPFVQQQADKRVYNVDKNITTLGGNASDVLKNIPSVTEDADGNISLRGSENVNILINGKPSTIGGGDKSEILQQIPADIIQSIEIISNPSAKYDAEGSAGIINIVTKRSEKENLSGNISSTYTIYDKASFNTSLNYRNKKINAGISYSFNYNPRYFDGFNSRKNIFSDTTFFSTQINDGDRNSTNHNIKTNFEYLIDKSASIELTFSASPSVRRNPEEIEFLSFDENQILGERRNRNISSKRNSDNYASGINYQKKFKNPQHSLSISGNYSNNKSEDNQIFNDKYSMINFIEDDFDFVFLQFNKDINKTEQYIFQADYIYPINKNSKLEAGIKSSVRDISGSFILDNFDTLSETFLPDSLNGGRFFDYTEQVYAAYTSYSNSFKNFNYQFGFRSEHTVIDGNGQSFTVENARIKNNYFKVFPSAFFSYKFKNDHQVNLNYSKRISRPWYRQLIPFLDVNDPLNLRIGNPDLNPEIFHSIELGWNKTFKKHFISSNIYYRQTNDNIGRIRTIDEEGVATTTFENLNKQYAYGIEFITKHNFTKWWDITNSFNGYQSFVNAKNVNTQISNSGFSYSIRSSQNFKVWKGLLFQTIFFYNGPMPTAQGKIKPMWSIDLALKKEFLHKKASITINAQDIFFERIFRFTQTQPSFEQTFRRARESRVVSISFSYRFGTNDNKNNKRRGNDGGGEMMEDM